MDESGTVLTFTPVGILGYALNSVNTYKVTIPAGTSIQRIQALSNVCSTLNTGGNINTACSNNATVNLAPSGAGILVILPIF